MVASRSRTAKVTRIFFNRTRPLSEKEIEEALNLNKNLTRRSINVMMNDYPFVTARRAVGLSALTGIRPRDAAQLVGSYPISSALEIADIIKSKKVSLSEAERIFLQKPRPKSSTGKGKPGHHGSGRRIPPKKKP